MKFYTTICRMPEDDDTQFLLLKTPEYCRSGFVVGYFQEGFYTDFGENDITEYVTEWAYLTI